MSIIKVFAIDLSMIKFYQIGRGDWGVHHNSRGRRFDVFIIGVSEGGGWICS